MRARTKLVTALLVGGPALLLAAELSLRVLFPVGRQAAMDDAEVQSHLGYGFSYDPDLYWYWGALPDEFSDVNAFGFRRTQPMEALPPQGVRRAIVLGDSQVYGGGVETDQAFPNIADVESGPDWEVLNAGLSGYRSLNVYRLLRKRLLAYSPDVLVVDCMPKDSPREDGPLVESSVGGGRLGELLWNSRLYYFGQLMVRVAGLAPWETLPWPLQLHEVRERITDPSKGDLRDSPDMGNLDLIARFAGQHGIQTVFMRYPVQRASGEVGCMAWDGSLPEGYPVFDACAVMQADGRPASELFLDNNHLTPAGNQLVGAALAELLAGLELPAAQ